MTKPVLSLLSDFGLRDPYVAEMKAVVLAICPQAEIVDISHSIEKFNTRMGAFVLASASRYFQKGTIHIAVVDPGVGTRRRPLVVKTKRSFYIGPDNGLLILAAQNEGITQVRKITNPETMRQKVSSTFHGRDIFAPAAAHLANGRPFQDLGPEVGDYVIPKFAKTRLKANEVNGSILHIDDFGNIITNITEKDLEKVAIKQGAQISIRLRNKSLKTKLCRTYGEVAVKTALTLIGSHAFLEIAVNQDSASKLFNANAGESLVISSGA